MSRRSATGGNRERGSHWIRDKKRLRIYARDGWRCVWCSALVACARDLPHVGGELATLDHVLPREKGGSNDVGNLVTACEPCNRDRGSRSEIAWAFERFGAGAGAVLDRMLDAMLRPLP